MKSQKRIRSTKLNSDGTPLLNGVRLELASSVTPKNYDWLWDYWLAAGEFHILAGPPGTGKTTVAIEVAAILTRAGMGGCSFPDKSKPKLCTILIWSGEDSIEATLVPRLIAAGADLTRVYFIRGTEENGRSRPFCFVKDIPILLEEIDRIGGVDFIVIDSIVQAVAGDSNKNSDVRRALAPLVEMAQQFNCAILGITHLNKGSKGKDSIDRITGSLAFVATARIAWITIKVKSISADTPSSCVLVRAKTNIGPDDGGFEYQIRQTEIQACGLVISTSSICWSDTPLVGSAADILKFAEMGGAGEKTSAVDKAVGFLEAALANGGVPHSDIHAMAQVEEISNASIKRARSILNVVSQKQSGVGQDCIHIWSLPVKLTRQPFAPGNSVFGMSSMNVPGLFGTSGQDFAGLHLVSTVNVEPPEPPDPLEPHEPSDHQSQSSVLDANGLEIDEVGYEDNECLTEAEVAALTAPYESEPESIPEPAPEWLDDLNMNLLNGSGKLY